MKLVTTKFKSGGLHEKHVVATWNVGNHLSTCLYVHCLVCIRFPLCGLSFVCLPVLFEVVEFRTINTRDWSVGPKHAACIDTNIVRLA